MSEEAFERTSLYRRAFIEARTDCTVEEQRFFQENFREMRARVIPLVEKIQRDMPDYTVHDITHLDALWEMGSLLLTKEGDITPAEAFVFGGAVLLHDAGMTIAAYPGGLPEIERTIEWQDTIACLAQEQPKLTKAEITRQAIPTALRQLHAKAAESLALNSWKDEHGKEQYLIERSELRSFYGRSIGLIAYSHWWPVHKVGEHFSNALGAYPKDCTTTVDRLKVACLLRLSDALHIDRRRAPPFQRTLLRPEGPSADHWTAQEKIAKPRLEGDEIVFSSGDAFPRSESSAWWLLFEMIAGIDKELRDVDALLRETAKHRFSASRVRGASSPQSLSTIIETDEWKPVDTQLRISDVPKIIAALGGAKLYGENPTVALREMLQNSSDAVHARRKLEHRPTDWGQVTVSLQKHGDQWHLIVEDNGVGMSEQVLTGPLLDFGKSLWKSGLVTEEFPGLIKSGMHATGQFGIGFFSVFMLGKHIKVTSRKYTRERDSAKTLEFLHGTSSRPLLYPATDSPVDGGTCVEIALDIPPDEKGGLLYRDEYSPPFSLTGLLQFLAPAFEVTLIARDAGKSEIVLQANDWLTIDDNQLLSRISGSLSDPNRKKTHEIPVLRGTDGTVYGRARISGRRYRADACITVGGLRSADAFNFDGILAGRPLTAARDSATPSIPKGDLKGWVTQQAIDIAKRNIGDQTKANCAETILQCGGNPSDLPIARLGGQWLNIEAIKKFAAQKTKIVVHNDDEPTFEDTDDVRPSEFEGNLVLKPSILFVPKHFGGLSHSPNNSERYDYPKPTHNLSILVHLIIKRTWGTVSREVKTQAIGDVLETAITRPVIIYRRQSTTK